METHEQISVGQRTVRSGKSIERWLEIMEGILDGGKAGHCSGEDKGS